eukprot:TRINITY_DN325_c0_g4_i2.p1 TRINITY_DN325_c0_g4~~TRINITY_DN325_c0_g4_i2.p1  ORF type:complete len:1147 (-),score=388.80 TRINITY_DN325_c0_g4_i2:349-3789(-)
MPTPWRDARWWAAITTCCANGAIPDRPTSQIIYIIQLKQRGSILRNTQAETRVMPPTIAKVIWKLALVAAPVGALKTLTRVPPMVTPRPMASICTIEKRLLPLPASSLCKPLSVTLFMAANCIELQAPNTDSCTIASTSGHCGVIRANEMMAPPTSTVLTCRKRSQPQRLTSGAIHGLAMVPAMAAGSSTRPACSGEQPSRTCNNSGKRNGTAEEPMRHTRLPARPMLKLGSPNNPRRNRGRGCARACSQYHHTVNAASANRPALQAARSFSTGTSSASENATMHADSKPQPSRSKRGASARLSSARKRSTAPMPSTPMGTLIRKIQCHDRLSTSHPPRTGPTTGPSWPAIEIEASAAMQCAPGTARSTARRPTGNSIEPPRPCSTRASSSCGNVAAVAQKMEPSTNSRIAEKYILRVPKRSASQPEAGVSEAIVRVQATTTGCMSSTGWLRLRAMAGNAVLTMVVSSVCMKNPEATIHSKARCEWPLAVMEEDTAGSVRRCGSSADMAVGNVGVRGVREKWLPETPRGHVTVSPQEQHSRPFAATASEGLWTPLQQATFQRMQEPVGCQRHHRQHDHGREHAAGIEGALGGRDQQPDALLGPQELAHHRAHQRKAEAHVQAGQDPRQRRGDHHRRGHLAARGAQDLGVGDHVAVGFAHALEGIGKHHEEHHHHRQRHLGGHAQAEGNHEDGTQHHARNRVGDLDVEAEHIREQLVASQDDAGNDTGHRADQETQHGFFQRHQDLGPQRTLRGTLDHPFIDLRHDQRGLREEEGIDPADAGKEFPTAQHHHQDGDAQADHQVAARADLALGLGFHGGDVHQGRALACLCLCHVAHLFFQKYCPALVRALRPSDSSDMDFLAQIGPDAARDIDEALLVAHLFHHPRTRQVDRIDALQGRWARSQHIDLVGQGDGFFQVVGDEHHRPRMGRPQLQQLVLHQGAGLHVQCRERFIHEQDLGAVDEGLGQRHALAHAARELVGIMVAELVQAHAADPFVGQLVRLGLGLATEHGAGRDVLAHAAPGEDGVVLEHETDARVDAIDRLAHHAHLAHGRLEQAGDQRQRGGLAATGRPHDGDEFAARHAHGKVAQRHGGTAIGGDEAAGDIAQLDGRRGLASRRGSGGGRGAGGRRKGLLVDRIHRLGLSWAE